MVKPFLRGKTVPAVRSGAVHLRITFIAALFERIASVWV
jgi:hypothetical protein